MISWQWASDEIGLIHTHVCLKTEWNCYAGWMRPKYVVEAKTVSNRHTHTHTYTHTDTDTHTHTHTKVLIYVICMLIASCTKAVYSA